MAAYTIAPAAKSILTQATMYRPSRSKASDGTIGDQAHAARVSDHNPDRDGVVLAADLTHDPGHGVDAHGWIRWRVAKGDRRIKYAISNGEWWKPDGRGWRRYTGSNPHTKHVHVSIAKAFAGDVSEWFAGWLTDTPPAPPTPPPTPAPPPARRNRRMSTIVHITDPPSGISTDTWFLWDGYEALPLSSPAKADALHREGVAPNALIVDGHVRPKPLTWGEFNGTRILSGTTFP